MHKRNRFSMLLLGLGLLASSAWAQDTPLPMPESLSLTPPESGEALTPADAAPEADPPAASLTDPVPPPPAEAKPEKRIIMRGRAIPFAGDWIVNQNTVERYALPQDKGYVGFYETPYSTRAEIVDIRLVPPAKGQGLANTIILETKDLLGTADVVLPVLTQAGEKREERIEVLVIDEISAAYRSYLQKQIRNMFPTAVIEVLVANSATAVLNGYVERAEHVAPIENLVRGFLAARMSAQPETITVVNNLRFVGAMQVQLKVLIAEVQRSRVRDLGFDWNYIAHTADPWGALSVSTGTFSSRIFGADSNGNILPIASSSSGASNLGFVLQRNGQVAFQGYIRALQINNLAKILAEPNLVTTSGQPAYFNVGGQVPVLTPQGNGTIGITYRDFGTNLRFVPTVLGEGRVRLEVRPEVSELNFANGVQLGNIVVPGFNVRVAETTVEMEAGQSFVVAGLIQKRIIADSRKIPGLGELPVAGALFQNKSYRQDESEIMIMVTPHLVDALDQAPCKLPGRESRVPNDIEYYIGSKFEPPCFDDPYRGHIKNWKAGHPSPAIVPVTPYDNYGQPPTSQNFVPTPGAPTTDVPTEEMIPTPELPPADGASSFIPPGAPTYEVSYGSATSGATVEPISVPAPNVPEASAEFSPVAAPETSPKKSAWRRGASGSWR